MKTVERQRRLRLADELMQRASGVLEDSRELIQERQAQAATREQLLRRRDEILREVPRDHS